MVSILKRSDYGLLQQLKGVIRIEGIFYFITEYTIQPVWETYDEVYYREIKYTNIHIYPRFRDKISI